MCSFMSAMFLSENATDCGGIGEFSASFICSHKGLHFIIKDINIDHIAFSCLDKKSFCIFQCWLYSTNFDNDRDHFIVLNDR
jgi:hypothetical protein